MNAPADALQRHRFDVVDYRRMGVAGVFGPDARVELIDGEIIDMVPIGPNRDAAVDRLNRLLTIAVAERAIVRTQGSFELSMWSEPEPDLALLKPVANFYANALPTPTDVLLVVEVADSSLARDRDVRLPLYARHGVPEAWLVDLEGGELTVHREPSDGGYGFISRSSILDRVSPLRLPDVTLDLSGLF